MGVVVKLLVDGVKADEGGLSSFNHGQPDNGGPKKNKGSGGVGLRRKTGLTSEDQSHNKDGREDQQTRRVNTLEGITVAGGCGFFNQ